VRIVMETTLESVLGRLAGTPRVVVSGNFATPWQTLAILDKALPEYHLFALNAQPGTPDRDGVVLETPFVGPGMRHSERLRYLPCRLSLVPSLLSTTLQPDVVLVHVSAPVGGTVSLGTEVNILPAAIEAVRARGGLVIAQVNPQMPYTYGDGVLPTADIDIAVEADVPLPSPAVRAGYGFAQGTGHGAGLHELIGARVAALVPQAATLQLGIGGVPDAVLAALRHHRDLSVWSEMFSDGVLELERAGALDLDVPVTASFAFGTPELYAWIDGNPRIRMLRTEKTNDPGLISRQRTMVSVNSALQVDLFAQANAARVHGMIYSGFGGQTDFVVGALHSRGGRAIIALPSWHPKADVSTIVPRLAGPVTSFQHSYIVSEQGIAVIWGNDASTQAAQIIGNVAHPEARAELLAAGRELGFRLD
jgi:acyl-CoA hydrolase